MTNQLKDKIDQVKDEHAAELVDQRTTAQNGRAMAQAIFMLGRIKQNDHIAVAISTNLTAQTIRALEHFQEEGMYKPLGYTTFVDFLEKSEYSPMSKRQYYERRELMNAHGDEVYDLLTSVGISVRTQRLLGKGELSIKDDKLLIGDQEVDIANSGVIKDVLREFVDEIRDREASEAKKDAKIEKLELQVDRGEQDLEQLQRSLDALRDSDPYDKAFGRAVLAILELTRNIGQLTDKRKAEVSGSGMRAIWDVVLQVRKSYGIDFTFEDNGSPASISHETESLIRQVLAEDDDFGDED